MTRTAMPRIALSALLALPGCLPEDARPSPGRAVVSISADVALQAGALTADGWAMNYERFLLSLGHVWLGGSRTCNQYTGVESAYLRIFDMQQPNPQTVATVHALGDCSLAFRLSPPVEDSVLGPGVDEEVRAFMREPGSDAWVQHGARAVFVAGTATRSESIYRFTWSFRRPLGYSGCAAISLRGGEAQTLDIRIRGMTLFESRTESGPAELRFEPYVAADTNGDHEITLEELAGVPAGMAASETLLEHLYLRLVPQLPRVDDAASCFDGTLSAD